MLKSKECFVVLGNLMNKDGALNSESRGRVLKLHDALKNKTKPELIFFCGWEYREDCAISIARAMLNFFLRINKNNHQLYLSDQSRDTVGDAIFLKKKFQSKIKKRKINVFTSDYHASRTKFIFSFIFPENKIEVHQSKTNKKNIQKIKSSEKDSLYIFKKTMHGVSPGDINNIFNALKNKHPYYNGEVYKKIK